MRPHNRPMGRFSLWHLGAALILLGALALSGCGGGGDEAAKDGAPGAAASAAATREPGAAEVTIAPADAFAGLQSYRVTMRIVLQGTAAETPGSLALDVEGSYVAPDRSHVRVTARQGELQLEEESIAIGGQTWVKSGDAWVEGPPQFQLSDFSPASLLVELGPEQLRLLTPSEETVNGVATLRYDVDRADIESLRALGALLDPEGGLEDLPEEFTVGLWLAEDGGWPARITMMARGATNGGEEVNVDFSMDITDVNSPAIQVEPPV